MDFSALHFNHLSLILVIPLPLKNLFRTIMVDVSVLEGRVLTKTH